MDESREGFYLDRLQRPCSRFRGSGTANPLHYDGTHRTCPVALEVTSTPVTACNSCVAQVSVSLFSLLPNPLVFYALPHPHFDNIAAPCILIDLLFFIPSIVHIGANAIAPKQITSPIPRHPRRTGARASSIEHNVSSISHIFRKLRSIAQGIRLFCSLLLFSRCAIAGAGTKHSHFQLLRSVFRRAFGDQRCPWWTRAPSFVLDVWSREVYVGLTGGVGPSH